MVKKFDTVIFDLDSTLVNIEGLEWLAHQEKNTRLPLTSAALEGKIPLQTAYQREVSLLAPSYTDMLTLGRKYQQSLVEDAVETVEALHFLGKDIWMVTNNFHPAIDIVANSLNIPLQRVFGTQLFFNDEGFYQGFDDENPLTRNEGKTDVIKKHIDPSQKVAFIGDSFTDLETKPVVDLFVGYGGVITRPAVKDGSHVFIATSSLSPILSILLNHDEMLMLEKHYNPSLIAKVKRASRSVKN